VFVRCASVGTVSGCLLPELASVCELLPVFSRLMWACLQRLCACVETICGLFGLVVGAHQSKGTHSCSCLQACLQWSVLVARVDICMLRLPLLLRRQDTQYCMAVLHDVPQCSTVAQYCEVLFWLGAHPCLKSTQCCPRASTGFQHCCSAAF
jgi:hypothetical protein